MRQGVPNAHGSCRYVQHVKKTVDDAAKKQKAGATAQKVLNLHPSIDQDCCIELIALCYITTLFRVYPASLTVLPPWH